MVIVLISDRATPTSSAPSATCLTSDRTRASSARRWSWMSIDC
jgi:hypothetical protein